MKRADIIAASDGDLIDPAQCTYISDIDGQACQADAGHPGGHSISGNPAYKKDSEKLLALMRHYQQVDADTEIPAPTPEQARAVANALLGKE